VSLINNKEGDARSLGAPFATQSTSGVCESYRRVPNTCRARPCAFILFGAMDVAKPYKFEQFGDIHGPNPRPGRTYERILDFSFGGRTANLSTKCHYNWFMGLILGVFYTTFRAWCLGAKFGWKTDQNRNSNSYLSFLNISPSKL
jgi:hypothetical protein